jgi:Cu/Ag efflux protein CusF
MRKHLFTAAAAALALALAVPAQAQQAKAAKAKGPAPHQVTGTIEKIEGDSVTVKNTKGESVVLVCNAKTKVATADKKEGATVADLKVGDKVQAQYVEQDGKNVCKKIGPPPPKKPATKEASPKAE